MWYILQPLSLSVCLVSVNTRTSLVNCTTVHFSWSTSYITERFTNHPRSLFLFILYRWYIINRHFKKLNHLGTQSLQLNKCGQLKTQKAFIHPTDKNSWYSRTDAQMWWTTKTMRTKLILIHSSTVMQSDGMLRGKLKVSQFTMTISHGKREGFAEKKRKEKTILSEWWRDWIARSN